MTALAPAQHFSAATRWSGEAWSLWWRRPGFFIAAALLLLALRYLLDMAQFGNASAAIIFISYFTDALVFAAVWLALSAEDGPVGLREGWRRLKGRRGKVARAGLWGLPSAAVGFLLLSVMHQLFEGLSALLGARPAGLLMLVWIFAVGWLCCMLLFAGIFACIEAATGEDSLWQAGLKGMRVTVLGWRPLLAVYTLFIVGAALCATVGAIALGHLSLQTLDGDGRAALEYWINWPALFIAVMALLAFLIPAGRDLLGLQHAAPEGEARALMAFGETLARRLGLALKALAAAVALSGVFALTGDLQTSLVGAAGLWLTGRAITKESAAWSDPQATFWARWRWLIATGLPLLLVWGVVSQL